MGFYYKTGFNGFCYKTGCNIHTRMEVCQKIMEMRYYDILFKHCRLPRAFHLSFNYYILSFYFGYILQCISILGYNLTLCTVLTLYHTTLKFNDPKKMAFENIVGKGENAGNQHFLLFRQCFLPFAKQI